MIMSAYSIKTASLLSSIVMMAALIHGCTGNNFTGKTSTRRGSEDAAKNEPIPDGSATDGTVDAGDGATTGVEGVEGAEGGEGSGDADGASGGSDATTAEGLGGDDDSSGSNSGQVDDDEVRAKLRGPLKVHTNMLDGGGKIRVQYISSKGDGEWQEISIPRSGGDAEIPGICQKNGPTEIRLVAIGKGEFTPPSKYFGFVKPNGAQVTFTMDIGGCLIGTCLDEGKDTAITLSCPKYDLTIEGIN